MEEDDRDEREEAFILTSLVTRELGIFAFLLFLAIILIYGQSIVVIFYLFVCIALSFLFLWFSEKVIGRLERYVGFTLSTFIVAITMTLIGLWGYIWLDYYFSSPHSKNYHAFFGVVMMIDFGAPGIVRLLDFVHILFGKESLIRRIRNERDEIRVWKTLSE